MRTYIHWLIFDTFKMNSVKKTLSEGNSFTIKRFYNHPTKLCFLIIEAESPDCYQDLNLDVNSMGSYIRRVSRKPADLGKGFSVEQFESIYGKLQEGVA